MGQCHVNQQLIVWASATKTKTLLASANAINISNKLLSKLHSQGNNIACEMIGP